MKTKYYITTTHYNASHNNDKTKVATFYSSYFSFTTENDPCGLPTQEFMLNSIEKFLSKKDFTYIDGTLAILTITQVTKEQYVRLGGILPINKSI